MNSIERKYLEFDPDVVLLNAGHRSRVVKLTLLYVMRAVAGQDFSDQVREITGWSGRTMADFRNTLKFDGYIQRELKFYIYERLAAKTFSVSSLILKEDRDFIQRFVKSDDIYQKALAKQCRAYKSLGYKPWALNTFCSELESVMDDLQVYCKKFSYVSLRFIAESNGARIDDLANELIAYGIYAVYRAYPEIEDTLHLLNIAKQAAHNRGQNLIKEATTKKRSRLSRQKDGTFVATVISLHSKSISSDYASVVGTTPNSGVMVCTSLMAGIDGTCVENESAGDVDRKRDLTIAVETLYQSFSSPRAKRFLELLTGAYDEDFSKWLGQANDEMFDVAAREVYAEKVREYLKVPVDKARSFVRGLRSQLQDFRN